MSVVSIGNVRTRAIVKQKQGRNITQSAIIRGRNYRVDLIYF